ncbi:hypothetical protein FE257_002694 [Aspergillus nanangensis]|uniref:NAD(P)-binding protein n=1 Tax=Aspergillus nanangensis TaxID=2582783 RepID=A0AAD4GNZ0_ASPNN|nr:hypothetical protein FE257_002694 [Aspergillus nanangensis]
MDNLPPSLLTSLQYVGLATLTWLTVTTASGIYDQILRPSTLSRYHHHHHPDQQPPWALVTGATGGIGFGFAQELCHRGFHLVLHGRNRAKLLQRQAELRVDFPHVQTRILVYDATDLASDIDALATELQDLHLTVLINNLGGDEDLDFPRTEENTFIRTQRVITRNALFTTHLTRILLSQLKRNAPALILNISSIAAYGFPYLTMYSASKGLINSFTASVSAELALDKTGVKMLGLIVGNVSSQGNQSPVSLFTPSSRQLARSALGKTGCAGPMVWAYWPHSLQGLIFWVLPRWMIVRISAAEMGKLKEMAHSKAKVN